MNEDLHVSVEALRTEVALLSIEVKQLRVEIAPILRWRAGAIGMFGIIVILGFIALAVDRIWDLASRIIRV